MLNVNTDPTLKVFTSPGAWSVSSCLR